MEPRTLNHILVGVIIILIFMVAYFGIKLRNKAVDKDDNVDPDTRELKATLGEYIIGFENLRKLLFTHPVSFCRGRIADSYHIRANGTTKVRIRLTDEDGAKKRVLCESKLYFRSLDHDVLIPHETLKDIRTIPVHKFNSMFQKALVTPEELEKKLLKEQ